MSSPTWTPDALASERRPYRGRIWRVVESQSLVSTMKLVDTLDEQAVLEDLVEAAKPPVPERCRGLHYLLATPFRYDAPYPRGSRFRRAGRTPGVYYAAETARTALAETAFYRILFFAASPGTPWPANPTEFTLFAVDVETDAALDLTAARLVRDRARWTDPVAYDATQDLAAAAREATLRIVRYASVRDRDEGVNVAVLACEAFSTSTPTETRTWRLHLSATGGQAICAFPPDRIGFARDAFADDPRLAGMVWERP
ncbi:RES family NAD+ phosphorylase [Salinarimonas chemoclinalis]|uniref:RES family NAD+ phosphorylase n=1 Tax=Salinarimonas chemoclinalis TaxID=3241599 RepID=UPI0035576699